MRTFKNRKFFRAGLSLGAGAGLGLVCTLFSALLLADVLHRFQQGDLVSAGQINENFAEMDAAIELVNTQRLAPIGSIVAWHKSISGAPAIPAGWVECNGGTVNDSESPLHNQAIPNLNAPAFAWNTGGSFLRGSSTSGAFEADGFQGHTHYDPGHTHGYNDQTAESAGFAATGIAQGWGGSFRMDSWRGTGSSGTGIAYPTDNGYGNPRYQITETRPVNMQVVWIMRIK